MRLWDAGPGSAGERLSHVQALLDQLWTSTPAGQPVLVRDARWLIPLAQSPATDDLGAYFDVAHRIADTLPHEDRLVVHRAGVCMAAGHLRSQIHYFSGKKGVPLDERSLVAAMRTTNALDVALLVQELVPLLEAYERACLDGNDGRRRELAGVICQGISPDPELFVNRVELLGAYSMIERLFIAADRDGRAVLTPMGRRHRHWLEEYDARIGRVAARLIDDCPRFRPVAGTYSPYGALYGFSSDLLEHMVLKASQPDAVTALGLEDVFVEGGADRLAWVTGWRTLPHVAPDVQARFAYPQRFAEDVFARLEGALRRRVPDSGEAPVVAAGRLFAVPVDAPTLEPAVDAVPDLPARYIHSSDADLVAARRAEYRGEADLEADRREGRCLVSYRTPRGAVTITKAVLTDILGEGRDAKVTGLPGEAVSVLKLMCGGLAAVP
jgi:hypothetical protein